MSTTSAPTSEVPPVTGQKRSAEEMNSAAVKEENDRLRQEMEAYKQQMGVLAQYKMDPSQLETLVMRASEINERETQAKKQKVQKEIIPAWLSMLAESKPPEIAKVEDWPAYQNFKKELEETGTLTSESVALITAAASAAVKATAAKSVTELNAQHLKEIAEKTAENQRLSGMVEAYKQKPPAPANSVASASSIPTSAESLNRFDLPKILLPPGVSAQPGRRMTDPEDLKYNAFILSMAGSIKSKEPIAKLEDMALKKTVDSGFARNPFCQAVTNITGEQPFYVLQKGWATSNK